MSFRMYEVSKKEKNKHMMISLTCGLYNIWMRKGNIEKGDAYTSHVISVQGGEEQRKKEIKTRGGKI